jgi:CHASE2 domain-containing sensor protein
MSEATSLADRWRIIRWVALAILAWGIFHAIGAWRFNHNPLRAVVVLGCVAGFLGFWLAMLAARQRRLSAEVTHVDRPGREPR